MLKPLRLLVHSLKQFAIGLGPALFLAFVCLFIQIALMRVGELAWSARFPPEPDVSLEEILNRVETDGWPPHDWRDDARDLVAHTIGRSVFFFFHALVALLVTGWLLRRRAGFDSIPMLRRALRGAGLITAAAAVVFAAAYFLDDVFGPTRYVRFNYKAAGAVAVWFGATALLLPARLMGHQPVAASGLVRNTVVAGIALVPWFYASEFFGAGLRHCRDCAGMFDGGLIFLAVLGVYLFGLTVSSAAVSAAACIEA